MRKKPQSLVQGMTPTFQVVSFDALPLPDPALHPLSIVAALMAKTAARRGTALSFIGGLPNRWLSQVN